jgi:hypothetical protein
VGDRSRGRYATPADFTRHDGTSYRGLHARRESLGFVYRPRTILCRAVPNRRVAIRANCCIAVCRVSHGTPACARARCLHSDVLCRATRSAARRTSQQLRHVLEGRDAGRPWIQHPLPRVVVEQPISRGSVCMLTGSTVLRCQCMYADGSTVLRCQVRERTAAAARVRALKADVEAQREKEKGLQYQFEVLQQARENNVVSA